VASVRVHFFRYGRKAGQHVVFGLSDRIDGSNLPMGDWTFVKTIEMKDAEDGRTDVGSTRALANIRVRGYHLTSMRMKDAEIGDAGS
jgi:hypothetical protein